MFSQFTDIGLLVRYTIAGLLSVVVNLLGLYVLVDILAWWYLSGAVVAFFVSAVVSFVLQKYWTFRNFVQTTQVLVYQTKWYLYVSMGNFIANIVLLYVLVDLFGVGYLDGQVVVLGVVAIVTFLVNKTITFRGVACEETDMSMPHTWYETLLSCQHPPAHGTRSRSADYADVSRICRGWRGG